MFGVRPRYVKTMRPIIARNGAIRIRGTVDKGREGIKKFACRFDRRGNFIDVVAVTSDGE